MNVLDVKVTEQGAQRLDCALARFDVHRPTLDSGERRLNESDFRSAHILKVGNEDRGHTRTQT